MTRTVDRIGGALYRALRVPLRAGLSSYFRGIQVRGAERIPRSGALLVVANHPATLSEVFVMSARLGRRLHFLAASFVFQPRIRGVFVRLCGTLPVYRRQDNPELTYRNEETFRACHEVFDEGGAIAMFPEGESETDRRVLPLKTGAARLALGYDAMPGREGTLTVVPVGVHFSDRTAFQSHVILSVGEPIDIAPFRAMGDADPQGAVRAMTAEMQARLEGLILNVPNRAVASFIRDVESLYLTDLREQRPGEEDLQLLRRMADCLQYYLKTDPERIYSGWRRTVGYRRKLRAIGLADEALRRRLPQAMAPRTAARLAIGCAAGLAPAALGVLANGIPYLATDFFAARAAPTAIQVSAGRIVAGLVFFPAFYGSVAFGLRAGAGWSWIAVGVTLAIALALGYFALGYLRWFRSERGRLRLALITTRRRRLVARLRAERRALIRLFDEAREEYLAAIG
jgi:glycerol-3-phosphate O-acyltransferase / dihydroxyacetone phosphate acyltransferase